MATAKKGGKSTKTAHVLNLLTAPGGGGEREAPAEAPRTDGEDTAPAEAETAAAEPAPPSRPLAPPILELARSNDEQLSEQIRDALENELAAALAAEPGDEAPAAPPFSGTPPAAAPEPEPEPESIPSPEPVNVPEQPPVPEPVKEPEPAKAPEPASVQEPEPAKLPGPAKPPEPDLIVLNVMEKLVEMKAPRYISMFGLCGCERCAADVRALTLTHLQPHYIVIPRGEANAMITVFESRFNSTIFAQLTRSCKVVMDNPRHQL